MKKLFLTLVFVSGMLIASAQTITIQAGPSFSKMDKSIYQSMDKNLTSINILAGIDYLNLKFFNLSTNLGFIQKGGKDSIMTVGPQGEDLGMDLFKSKMNFITLNTTANVKVPVGMFIPFVFAGPRIDYMVSYKEDASFIGEFDDAGELNRFQYGLIAGGGVKIKITRIYVGALFSYYINFSKLADFKTVMDQDLTLKDKTFTVNALVGLKLF